MMNCPHCGEPVANLAGNCPHCRSAITPEAAAVRAAAQRDLNAADGSPDYAGYLAAGSFVLAIGLAFAVSADDAWQVVGVVLAGIGGAAVLVGVIGLGVYIGMRQFEHWQRTQRPGDS